MKFEDFIVPAPQIISEKWQLGNRIHTNVPENGVLLLWVSDYRGGNGLVEQANFNQVREQLYKLSSLDFEIDIADLGDLISGKSLEDSHYILQEVLSACHYKNTIPIIIGGSNDFAYSLFSALNFHQKNIVYTQINHSISLSNEGKDISEKNYLSRILSAKNFSIKNFHALGYQKHLNEEEALRIIREVEFDVVRLADMMGSTDKTEPYFRKAHLVTLNCDAVESFSEPFSKKPQVNGLNKREICAYMKEIGLSENLKSVGIFNFDFNTKNILNHQLLAQMIWYLIEGINIRFSHPKERTFETYWLLIDEKAYAFKRDTFTHLWYFGEDEDVEKCLPCSIYDYEMAKKGILTQRLLKFISQ